MLISLRWCCLSFLSGFMAALSSGLPGSQALLSGCFAGIGVWVTFVSDRDDFKPPATIWAQVGDMDAVFTPISYTFVTRNITYQLRKDILSSFRQIIHPLSLDAIRTSISSSFWITRSLPVQRIPFASWCLTCLCKVTHVFLQLTNWTMQAFLKLNFGCNDSEQSTCISKVVPPSLSLTPNQEFEG